MERILECVPNFSEGRNIEIINAIAAAIQTIPSIKLLHIDIGHDANRTVYTFIGSPDAVLDACFNAIEVASNLINMEQHQGKHPRMGACDVCPLIPIKGISMDETIELSKLLGKRLGAIGIPVYLYEYSSERENRKRLEDIRKGEYEAIPKKLLHQEWHPDFGPHQFNKHFGIMALGAREFLLAYNVHLATNDIILAKQIAKDIRTLRQDITQQLTHVKAIAWYIEEYNCTQISTNITNYTKTSIFRVFDAIKKLAINYQVELVGSELIGLIPKNALLKDDVSTCEETQAIDEAILYLQLNNNITTFDKNKRILDYLI